MSLDTVLRRHKVHVGALAGNIYGTDAFSADQLRVALKPSNLQWQHQRDFYTELKAVNMRPRLSLDSSRCALSINDK